MIRTRLALLSLAAALALAAPVQTVSAAPQAGAASKAKIVTGTYTIEKPHTDIAFTVTHMGITKTHGSFTDYDGAITADGTNPEKSSVTFTIKAASINTGDTGRDGHLKSKDFFDVDKYPTITFKSTKIVKTAVGFVAIGDFTMHGVTKTIRLPFAVTGPQTGMDKKTHIGVDSTLVIDRKEYGLTWNAVIEGTKAVGDDVTITISMDLVKGA